MGKPLTMTIQQVADDIHRSQSTMRRLDVAGLIPAPMRLRNGLLWRTSDIELWVELGMPNREEFDRLKSEQVSA